MIDPALLTRLQKADHETYDLFNTIITKECTVIGRQILDKAILQQVLQDAIRARDWSIYQISNPGLPKETYYADIYKHDQDLHFEAFADSPAEALLKCYLAAVKG